MMKSAGAWFISKVGSTFSVYEAALSPRWGSAIVSIPLTACVVGCILTPLRGCCDCSHASLPATALRGCVARSHDTLSTQVVCSIHVVPSIHVAFSNRAVRLMRAALTGRDSFSDCSGASEPLPFPIPSLAKVERSRIRLLANSGVGEDTLTCGCRTFSDDEELGW